MLTRSNVAEFDRLLHWANGANVADREAALRYACAAVAETARPVRPMPKLNRSALTFSRVVELLHGLLATPSGGTFEQFAVAAFLDILVVNHSEGRISEPYAIRGASNESLSRRPPNRQHLRPSGRPSGGLLFLRSQRLLCKVGTGMSKVRFSMSKQSFVLSNIL